MTATPLQRPPQFADSPFVTDAEEAQFLRDLQARSSDIRDNDPRVDLGKEVNEFWWERPFAMAHIDGRAMSSLIVDPPNGRVPWLTAPTPPAPGAGPPTRFDNPEDRPLGERCLADSGWTPMLGGAPGANGHVQIVQTTQHLLLSGETVHTPRVVRIGAREHVRGNVRHWRGDSIGWWEGDTLVVDTVNFRVGTLLRGAGVGPGMGVQTGPEMHLIERFVSRNRTS